MSKAFTRESDDLPERSTLKRTATALPAGAKNYFTRGGIERLRKELESLAGQPDSPAARQRQFDIEQQLETAVVSPPPVEPWDQILFGATVTVREQQGEETVYRIVGMAETDLDRNWISWLSPLARALLKARVGDKVSFRVPDGEQKLKIISVCYNE